MDRVKHSMKKIKDRFSRRNNKIAPAVAPAVAPAIASWEKSLADHRKTAARKGYDEKQRDLNVWHREEDAARRAALVSGSQHIPPAASQPAASQPAGRRYPMYRIGNYLS